MIHSYHPGYRWSDQILDGVTETIHSNAPSTRIYIEYLDSKRFNLRLI